MAQWQGSPATYTSVYNQLVERYGKEEAENYDPRMNCFTFITWKQKGYSVKKGEKALHSHTFVKRQDVVIVNGKSELATSASYPKNVCLFYYLQVEKK
jgi:hypothetical protein